MTIAREHEIARLLIRYEQQQETSDLPDRTLLSQARVLVEQKTNDGLLDHELVELAHNVYRSLGAWEEEIALLRRYLRQDDLLDTTTRAWAWWHIVDCLALCEHDAETVSEQKALLRWVKRTFPLEECFFALADGTQANCWFRSGQANHWFAHYDDLAEHAAKTAHNWLDRFYCLRTATHLCFRSKDEDRLQIYLKNLISLEQEPVEVEQEVWTHIEIQILHIIAAQMNGHKQLMRERSQTAINLLWQWEPAITTTAQQKQFRSLCHNIAAPLYRAKCYDLAIPLFKKAIEYHTNPYYSYLWGAASVWVMTHQRHEVFPLLQQAAARYDGPGRLWEQFQKLPEFQDVKDDKEFQAVVEARLKDTAG
jgi:tetratricopeptide (TPR) repeat protein